MSRKTNRHQTHISYDFLIKAFHLISVKSKNNRKVSPAAKKEKTNMWKVEGEGE